jgi:hypothetical protein
MQIVTEQEILPKFSACFCKGLCCLYFSTVKLGYNIIQGTGEITSL